MPKTQNSRPLRFVQIGDLHATGRDEQNAKDFGAIIDEINANCIDAIDFVFLPGDIAENGSSSQYCVVRQQLGRLKAPWRAIPGDHDFEPGTLDAFYDTLGCRWLPASETVNDVQCLYLDSVSNGTGGPDFRLGAQQINWLGEELKIASQANRTAAIFMHTYPADFGAEANGLTNLIDQSSAVAVAMGHTHYNELANDGRTIYASTRSTGQLEEGAVGIAFVAIDKGVVSWKFKPLGTSWPFVMITSPPDRRLILNDHERSAFEEINASVWASSLIEIAEARINDQAWAPMDVNADGLLTLSASLPEDAASICVRVRTTEGNVGEDTIELHFHEGKRMPSGSDAANIGVWAERHLLGTQLGPNRNGRKW
jgi:3',5'-cyclic-AMP phosphodiesterase